MGVSGKLSVNAVKAWAEQLPFTNMPVVARETYRVVEQLEVAGLPSGQKMQVLALTERPAMLVLKTLRHRLATETKPGDQLLALGNRFCERLIAACDALLSGEVRQGLFGRGDSVSRQALALCNRYIEQWYLLHAVSHRRVPAGFWEVCRRHASQSSETELAPIARLLALHLACPAGLTLRQFQSITDLLAALPMQLLLTLGHPAETDRGQAGFIWPEDDRAPQLDMLTDSDSLRIDLTGLLVNLRADSGTAVESELLAELLNRWDGVLPDKQGRRKTGKPLATSVVIGLSGVHRLLDEEQQGGGASTGSEKEPASSVSDEDKFQQTSNPFARRSTSAVEAHILDISQGGCRLLIAWDAIQTGDIVAVHWGSVDWRIGSLSWISRDGAEWQCGVQWLLEQAEPAMVSFDQAEPGVALMGRCFPDGGQGVVYGASTHKARFSVDVTVGEEPQKYSLISKKSIGLVELAHIEQRPQAAQMPVLEPLDGAGTNPASIDDDVWDLFAVMGGSVGGNSGGNSGRA